jgi:titin
VTVTRLATQKAYQFRVAAVTAQGVSAFSSVVSRATLSGVTTAPRSVAVSAVSATSVSLSWAVPATLNGGVVTDYRVQYRLGSAGSWLTFVDAVSTRTSVTVTRLATQKAYQFRVAAVTARGVSAAALAAVALP